MISNEAFDYFSRHATVIQQRNRLTAEKTVAKGQLFSIEAIPPACVFYQFIGTCKERPSETNNTGELWSPKTAMVNLRKGLGTNENRFSLIIGGATSVGLGLTAAFWSTDQ